MTIQSMKAGMINSGPKNNSSTMWRLLRQETHVSIAASAGPSANSIPTGGHTHGQQQERPQACER